MAASFTSYYERHCREVFHLVSANQVEKLRQVYMTFYNDMPDHYMRLIQTYPEITEAVWRWDCTMYDVSFFSCSVDLSVTCILIYFQTRP